MMLSNIIYKYSCSQCQSTYIGETQRHLISRICEHKGISPRTSMPFSNSPFSNIREHALSFDHPIKVDNFSVLARCPSHDLRLLESIFIHKFSPNLNNQASSFSLQILSWGIPFFFGYIFSIYINGYVFELQCRHLLQRSKNISMVPRLSTCEFYSPLLSGCRSCSLYTHRFDSRGEV